MAMQATVRQDTAGLLARYGANLAFAGTSGSMPVATAASTKAPSIGAMF